MSRRVGGDPCWKPLKIEGNKTSRDRESETNVLQLPEKTPGGRGCVGRLQSAGPFLAAVKNSDQFQPLAADPVRNDVGGIRHHQLTRAENTSWATHLGVCSEQIDCL